jgi:hypothetical protein
MKTSALTVWTLLLLAALLAGCGALEVELVQRTTPTGITLSPDSTPPSGAETAWTRYTHDDPYLSFEYPAAWQAPTVTVRAEEGEDRSISVTLFSDPPLDPKADWLEYPEGAYGITITYKENASQTQLREFAEKDQMIMAFMDLELIADGESTLVYKAYCTRLGSVQAGGFNGVDYIATLPANAEAMYWWTHNTVLVDSRTRVITITGQPLNVKGLPADNWRDLYRAEDERHQDLYWRVVNSLSAGR